MSIEWDDRSNAIAERFVCVLGSTRLDLYRERGAPVWWVDFSAPSQVCQSRHGFELVGGHDADAAKVRALVLVRPAIDAIAERAAEVARDLAVAVAGARLHGVESIA